MGWLALANSSGNFKILASNNNLADKSDPGELFYMRGCDDFNFISLYRKPSKLDTKAALEMQKYNDSAEKDFSRAIALIPDCANAYWKRGRCKRNRWRWFGKPEDNLAAINDYKKAIELAPTSTEAHYSLMKAYVTGGKSELAKEEFQTILKLDPGWHSRKDLQGKRQTYDYL
jgi:tetratricopeptide (TPR) repeat protein